MRVIASRHRVGRADLITDTTEEKIVVWLYSGEISIAEVFVSRDGYDDALKAWNCSKQSDHQRTDIGGRHLSDWNKHGGSYLTVTVPPE
jgi:hypothetical protein